MEIKDSYGRSFKTLRISLTNACNLACSYCVDTNEKKANPHNTAITTVIPDEDAYNKSFFNNTKNSEIDAFYLKPSLTIDEQKVLSFKELYHTVEVLVRTLRITTIRLTGGEPLLYPNIYKLILLLTNLRVKIKLTTNGVLLSNFMKAINPAHIDSLNISIDALDSDVFFQITKRNNLNKVLSGIDEALLKGIKVKLNCVVIKNVNESQVLPLLEYAKEKKVPIRFLEIMNMGHLLYQKESFLVTQQQILDIIAAQYIISPLDREPSATATYWQTNDGYVFGIIANESNPFCNDCNRLRLDSYGNVYGCLSNEHGVALAPYIHDKDKVIHLLTYALSQKQPVKFKGSALSMLDIGG
jgi:GTP 3',8-cyclase